MPTQVEKGAAFYALHNQAEAFLLPNPYDPGTARLLAYLGFEALATTSGGFACSNGRPDYAMERDETIAHAQSIVNATGLPVTADLENGFGDSPEAAVRNDPPCRRRRPCRWLDRRHPRTL